MTHRPPRYPPGLAPPRAPLSLSIRRARAHPRVQLPRPGSPLPRGAGEGRVLRVPRRPSPIWARASGLARLWLRARVACHSLPSAYPAQRQGRASDKHIPSITPHLNRSHLLLASPPAHCPVPTGPRCARSPEAISGCATDIIITGSTLIDAHPNAERTSQGPSLTHSRRRRGTLRGPKRGIVQKDIQNWRATPPSLPTFFPRGEPQKYPPPPAVSHPIQIPYHLARSLLSTKRAGHGTHPLPDSESSFPHPTLARIPFTPYSHRCASISITPVRGCCDGNNRPWDPREDAHRIPIADSARREMKNTHLPRSSFPPPPRTPAPYRTRK
ncbi:hypothetical protein BJ912DRAFT_1065811 [Pholiota molesta]|nr:hypothetical protein BJ912DRAFT_1065811 [Pholiota molesta]